MRRVFAIAIVIALAATACAGARTSTDVNDVATTVTHGGDAVETTDTAGRDAVVLTVTVEPGFGPVELLYDPLPQYVLYGDGRLIAPGPVPTIYPSPLLPELQVVRLGDAQMGDILDAVADAGLDVARDVYFTELSDVVADASNTALTYVDETGTEHRMSVLALGVGEEREPEVTSLQRLIDVLERTVADADSIELYQPYRYQIVISQSGGAEEGEAAEVRPWPLPIAAVDSERVSSGILGCVVVDGADAAQLSGTLADASQLTLFQDRGTVYRLTIRSLLAYEVGCPN